MIVSLIGSSLSSNCIFCALFSARQRRGRVGNSRFHGVKARFLHSEDVVAAADGVARRVKTMPSYSLDQMTTAMPLPKMSGEGGAGGGVHASGIRFPTDKTNCSAVRR